MSKIIVRRQEYANNGTHANEIEAVVKQNLIANTLSSATDIAPSVGLLKSVSDTLATGAFSITSDQNVSQVFCRYWGKLHVINGRIEMTSSINAWSTLFTIPADHMPSVNVLVAPLFNNSAGGIKTYIECTRGAYTGGLVQPATALASGDVYKFTMIYLID